jgi:predicted amidohydrolase YtcJ
MMMRRLALLMLLAAPVAAAPTLVDKVHGYTLAGGGLREFTAIAFDGGKILETGAGRDLKAHYPDAKIIDAHGATMLPGLIDAHGHIIDLGLGMARVGLEDTHSLPEALEKVRVYAHAHPEKAWILGGGWNQFLWHLQRFPTAAELDAVVSDRPVRLDRIDDHAIWLNSAALRAAGITKDTPDPAGGRIERDAAGNPTGVLMDNANDLVKKVMPAPTKDERRAAVNAVMARLNSFGVTGVGDAGLRTDIPLYREMADEGALTVRIYAMIGGVDEEFRAMAAHGPLIGYGNDFLTVRSVKLFADGSVGSRGAAMLEPYSDAPGQLGLHYLSDADMQSKMETALKAGFQVNVHAIGDAANRQVLNAFEAAYKSIDGRPLRNRIEHAQIVAPADFARFKQLDLIASMQPTAPTSDMNMAEDRVGKERLKGAYAWRTFLDQGTKIAAGSDFPVESPNPFLGFYAAVTRKDLHGMPAGGWHAEQAVTLLEIFRAYTLDAAYAEHMDASTGSLEKGKWADFILIDRDPFSIASRDLWRVRVRQTWVSGKKVYQSNDRSD